jgi:curved DNA-binding protein CbpA
MNIVERGLAANNQENKDTSKDAVIETLAGTPQEQAIREEQENKANDALEVKKKLQEEQDRIAAADERRHLAELYKDKEKGFNPYEVLGISKDASVEDVRNAYHSLAKQYHTDKLSGKNLTKDQIKEAEDKFKVANRANEILGDKDNRKIWDDIEKEVGGVMEPGDLQTKVIGETALAIRTGVEDPGSALAVFKGDRVAATMCLYEIQTQSGALEELSGNLKQDSKKIQEFFDGYGMHMDEATIQKFGAGMYEGAFKENKKREKNLFRTFFQIIKEFEQNSTKGF